MHVLLWKKSNRINDLSGTQPGPRGSPNWGSEGGGWSRQGLRGPDSGGRTISHDPPRRQHTTCCCHTQRVLIPFLPLLLLLPFLEITRPHAWGQRLYPATPSEELLQGLLLVFHRVRLSFSPCHPVSLVPLSVYTHPTPQSTTELDRACRPILVRYNLRRTRR